MTVASVPGHVRLRAFQLGKETVFGTPVAATRRMPWTFVPNIDPHWTRPDVDTGTLDPAQAPYRTGIDLTGTSTGPLAMNDAHTLWAALLKGGETAAGAGAAKTWDIDPASTSADVYELFTGEWGDEVTGDNMQFASGIVDSLTLTWPQDLGPVTHSANWRFAKLTYPSTLTGALAVDPIPNYLYAADTKLYIDSVAGSIGISPITDALHDSSITVNANTDVKRFMNGSNARFNVSGYGRGLREIEVAFTLAKTTAALAEFANFLNAAPTERFVVLDTTSAAIITGVTPYSHKVRFAGHWYARTEQTVGGNSVAQLVCRQMYDTVLGKPIEVIIVNSNASLP